MNCPLTENDAVYCPAAFDLAPVALIFANNYSIERSLLTIEKSHHLLELSTDLQTALQKIYGLLLSTSACPLLSYYALLIHNMKGFATFQDFLNEAVCSIHIDTEQPGRTKMTHVCHMLKEIDAAACDFAGRFHAVFSCDANINALVKLANMNRALHAQLEGSLR